MSKKILLVDDDKDLVETMAQVLKSQGYELVKAHSASEGLKHLVTDKPDLLILDVIMENDTAGFEMAYQIRSKSETSRYKEFMSIPIIMLTSINQVTNSRFSLDDDNNYLPKINAFLTKPLDAASLLNAVKKHI